MKTPTSPPMPPELACGVRPCAHAGADRPRTIEHATINGRAFLVIMAVNLARMNRKMDALRYSSAVGRLRLTLRLRLWLRCEVTEATGQDQHGETKERRTKKC